MDSPYDVGGSSDAKLCGGLLQTQKKKMEQKTLQCVNTITVFGIWYMLVCQPKLQSNTAFSKWILFSTVDLLMIIDYLTT